MVEKGITGLIKKTDNKVTKKIFKYKDVPDDIKYFDEIKKLYHKYPIIVKYFKYKELPKYYELDMYKYDGDALDIFLELNYNDIFRLLITTVLSFWVTFKEGIVHNDIKLENMFYKKFDEITKLNITINDIKYNLPSSKYKFYLGDFGKVNKEYTLKPLKYFFESIIMFIKKNMLMEKYNIEELFNKMESIDKKLTYNLKKGYEKIKKYYVKKIKSRPYSVNKRRADHKLYFNIINHNSNIITKLIDFNRIPDNIYKISNYMVDIINDTDMKINKENITHIIDHLYKLQESIK